MISLLLLSQMYCYYKCSVALPVGSVGWSAVCDCGILIILTYFLDFYLNRHVGIHMGVFCCHCCRFVFLMRETSCRHFDSTQADAIEAFTLF